MMKQETILVEEIANATRLAVIELFRDHPGQYYYCCLFTTGDGQPPYLSAWSEEALTAAVRQDSVPVVARRELRWSYADSPFHCFGERHFSRVKALFACRPPMDPWKPEQWQEEWQSRVDAMEAAIAKLDSEGLFGRGIQRSKIVINVEVAPPDRTNTERAVRLNPREALSEWLVEAGEE